MKSAAQIQGNQLKSVKTLLQRGLNMYRQIETKVVTAENPELKFEGKLAKDNRWVIMSELIPWQEFEEEYAKNFSETGMGAPAKPFRIALGSLIIKERLGTSDRETVEQIRENPYLQYFLGIAEYSNKAPFEASMLVHFRQRIGEKTVNEINRKIVERNTEKVAEKNPEKKSMSNQSQKIKGG
jgi:transposase, IS5 family